MKNVGTGFKGVCDLGVSVLETDAFLAECDALIAGAVAVRAETSSIRAEVGESANAFKERVSELLKGAET